MTYYKIIDRPTNNDFKKLGIDQPVHLNSWANPFREGIIGIAGVLTCEQRPPKQGEWFLSGAAPEVYKAYHDMTMVRHIARLVCVKTTVTIKTVEVAGGSQCL